MAVAAIKPTSPVAERVQEIAERLAARCVDSGLVPSAAVTDADLNALVFDEARYVLRVGMVRLTQEYIRPSISDAEEDDGGAGPVAASAPARGRSPIHAIHGRNPTAIYRALGRSYFGADGALKPLLRFEAGDLAKFAADGQAQIVTFRKKVAWAKRASRLLVEHGVKTIEELPADVLAKLDAEAAKIWGRG